MTRSSSSVREAAPLLPDELPLITRARSETLSDCPDIDQKACVI